MPDFVTEASGTGAVESFTVVYGRGGEVEHGVVMLRTPQKSRTLARVPANDGATLARLRDLDRTPVGSSGDIVAAGGMAGAGVAGGVACSMRVFVGR